MAVGSVEACRRLKSTGDACYNTLYALKGAIQDIRWHELPKEFHVQLKNHYGTQA